MAFSQKTQFPRSFVRAASVTTTASALFPANAPVAVAFFVIANGDATPAVRTIIFRGASAGAEVFRVTVPQLSSMTVPGFRVGSAGLEVIDAASVAAGVVVTVFYTTHN